MPKTVRIKKSALSRLDQSKQRKEFFFDGQAYNLRGEKECSIPDAAADRWAADDSDIEIVYNR